MFKTLRELTLNGNTHITDQGLRQLAGSHIYNLSLKNTNIGDAGMEHIAALPDLIFLSIEGSRVTAKGIERALQNHNLRRIIVAAGQLEDSQRIRLQREFPSVSIDNARTHNDNL